jgi:hypothetical protein
MRKEIIIDPGLALVSLGEGGGGGGGVNESVDGFIFLELDHRAVGAT